MGHCPRCSETARNETEMISALSTSNRSQRKRHYCFQILAIPYGSDDQGWKGFDEEEVLKLMHSTNLGLVLCWVAGQRDTPMNTHGPRPHDAYGLLGKYAFINDPTNWYKITNVLRTERGTAVIRDSIMWGVN